MPINLIQIQPYWKLQLSKRHLGAFAGSALNSIGAYFVNKWTNSTSYDMPPRETRHCICYEYPRPESHQKQEKALFWVLKFSQQNATYDICAGYSNKYTYLISVYTFMLHGEIGYMVQGKSVFIIEFFRCNNATMKTCFWQRTRKMKVGRRETWQVKTRLNFSSKQTPTK